jgi:hypothetical protein
LWPTIKLGKEKRSRSKHKTILILTDDKTRSKRFAHAREVKNADA